jgi:beta-1,4-mannosyltransferase
MRKEIKIACLPVAGIENPYQSLMIKGINKSKQLNAFTGVDDRFLGIIKTWIKYNPSYIHFDWIHSYYLRRKLWMTYLLLPVFVFQVMFVKYCTKTKFVWTMHNIMPHNSNDYIFNKYLRSWFAKKCLWIRVFSEATINKASGLFKIDKNIFKIVPEGDYTSVYPDTISRNDARKHLNLDKDERVFLYIGFIRPYKGLDKLIDVFDKLKIENSKLIIVGYARDKSYIGNLKDKVTSLKNNLIIINDVFVPDNELQIYYNASDVVVLPFDKVENSGSVIMAMGFAKLILAPRIGVLVSRLAKQTEYLYSDLEITMKQVMELTPEKIIKLGKENKLSLKRFKWSDYQKEF